jgi:hypothetical protein
VRLSFVLGGEGGRGGRGEGRSIDMVRLEFREWTPGHGVE